MLLGGDLGFLSRFVVAVFLVLAGPLLGLVVRWKWRRAVVKREEIDRLLVFASEEAARAELETAADYGFDYGSYSFGSVLEGGVPADVQTPAHVYSDSASVPGTRQQTYQCAHCFSPASTRCSRCKAVRYCSGKCQIIHWRLGHKDECQPPSSSNHGSNGDGTNHFKAFKQVANEDYAGQTETEEKNSPVSIDASFAEHAHSKASMPRVSNAAEDIMKGNNLTDVRTTNTESTFSSYSFPTSTACQSFSSISISDSNDSDGIIKNVGIGSGHTETSQSGCIDLGADENTKSNSLSSISSSVDGALKSSLLASSVPSSDVWKGIAHYSRSKVNAMENVAHPDSEDVIASNCSDSQLLPNCSSKMARTALVPSMNEQNSKVKPPRKANDGAQLSHVKDNVDMRRSSTLRPKSRNTMDLSHSSENTISSHEESRHSLSTAYHACPVEHLMESDTLKVNSARKASHNSLDGLKNVPHAPRARQAEQLPTKSPHVYPSSSVQRHASVKNDGAQVTACLSGPEGARTSKSGLKSSMLKVVDQLKPSKSSRHNSLGSWSEFVGRYNNKGLFPYDLFVKLYNSYNVELRPFGLTNCGNSCYANAVLQCLAFTPPFTAYFLQGFHSKGCTEKEWCFTCEFEALVLKAKDGNSPLSPMRIISHLENIGSSLGNGREEDAHEFLRYVIETMQSVCLKDAGVHTPSTLEEQTSLVGLTFGGFLRSKIECLRCGGKSERNERMMDLTVEIDGDIGSLEGALKQFTHTEMLDGENKYHCSRCKSYEKARKKLKILEAPNILTIALKRFQSGKYGKLNKTITFPEILNLASYMSGTSDKSPIYRLYGVIVHLDVMNAAFSGHYVCYVKNFQNKWFKVDDSTVKPVDLETVLSKGAYMLLYSRCSPRAPRLIRTSPIAHDPRPPKPCKSWDFSKGEGRIQASSWPHHTTAEDSSSENSSSLFSEGASYSTESSNRDSISTEEFVDQLFGDPGGSAWNTPWRKSTDSDTSSTPSSPFSDNGFWRVPSGPNIDPTEVSKRKDSDRLFCPDAAKHCRNLGGHSSSSSRTRLGSDKAYGNMKCR